MKNDFTAYDTEEISKIINKCCIIVFRMCKYGNKIYRK